MLVKVSHDLLYELVDPIHIPGIFEARNFKFSKINVNHDRR